LGDVNKKMLHTTNLYNIIRTDLNMLLNITEVSIKTKLPKEFDFQVPITNIIKKIINLKIGKKNC